MSQNGPEIIYALRRTLPPWSFEANLAELDQLVQFKVEELIVKVDTEEFSHGHIPLDHLKKYQKNLFRIKEKLASLGIRYSINPWATQGHADRGRYAETVIPGVQTMVNCDGAVSTGCACPLSTAWQEHIKECWRLYAETEPHIIWVEDDIRSFNHGIVRFGCFCPLHMARFSSLVGRKVSREELVEALIRPGDPHPWRRIYLKMQGDIMIETAAMLSKTVHKYSPATSLGLMSSGPRNHVMEGRRWKEFAEALADGMPLYSRPSTSVYQENSLRDNYYGADNVLLTRQELPAGIIEESEVDNWNFTRYSKSVAFTAVQMQMSAAFGCQGITLNLYDHAGSPMAEEPEMGKMLQKEKDFMSELLRAHGGAPFRYRGVRMLFSDRYAELCHLPENARLMDLGEPGFKAVFKLGVHGIPVVYTDEPCRVACGQSIRGYSEDEIKEMLGPGQGLFLDAGAALALWERGMGELIGVKSAAPLRKTYQAGVFSAEEFYNPDFGGRAGKFLSTWFDGSEGAEVSFMEFMDGSVEITRLVDPDLKVLATGMTAFNSPLGGRVVISSLSMVQPGGSYNCTYRRQLLEGVFKYLSYGKLPVVLEGSGVYQQLFRSDSDRCILAGFFNLSLDVWEKSLFRINVDPGSVYKRALALAGDGSWHEISMERKDDEISLAFPWQTGVCKAAVIKLEK